MRRLFARQGQRTQQEQHPSSNIQEFREVLASARNIIVVSGAGLSAASGIPTFRGDGGMWRRHNVLELATPQAFRKNPSQVWQFYHYRREKANASQPNNAHKALAYFSVPSVRERLGVDRDSTFYHITQNVDGLNLRAIQALSQNHQTEIFASFTSSTPPLLEMHGRINNVQCTSPQCGFTECNPSSPICPALAGTEQYLDQDIANTIPVQDLPKCSRCGALTRPGVVWFGETPYHSRAINYILQKADLCLVVGTSSLVKPAADFPHQVKNQGGKVAIFNTERTQADSIADFIFLGPCETTLPACLGVHV
ncbi:DHS-like NAD/FAD-binding domain-containing protein [Schizopora paradoxa]|uniref:DHS-like NAD/FAD-binding domain-containing protein n=1 Tax=Schizopora paradoxa TaxID=27342 RepID=A0A0H2S1L9_9AGAM|nr:DHS-like NAD/FAD-binding domain-containing protein [Schizopora paradoxa]